MPKIKTHRSASKRFRLTRGGKGKLMRTKQGKSHLRRKKQSRTKRLFDEMLEVECGGIEQRVTKLAPYLKLKGK